VFVFAFSRLVYHLVHHPDWAGVGEFALLFMMIWLPWTQFTWSANAVSGNQRTVRALFLVGTVASVPMAASITTALDDGGGSFAIPLAVILSLGLFTMLFGLPATTTSAPPWCGTRYRTTSRSY
jgi:low temperature requirement protein LtrA